MRRERRWLVAVAAGVWLLAAACGPSAVEREAADREEIQALLEDYLPELGRAYTEQDADLIAPWVAPKEIARVNQRIEELYGIGSVLEPVFHRVAVEDLQVWNNSNAFVTTVETWDVLRYATGTMELIGEDVDQTQRVRYQMKRENGAWKVLYRTIEE